jgi:hypothetical protein
MLLIDLHNALLLGSQFPAPTQLALTVSLKTELLRQSQSNAVLLLWLAGSTSKQTPELQQQLQALIQAGVLQALVNLLPDVDHCSSATSALLQCITRLAEAATPQQLAALWVDPVSQARLISASCSSLPAGRAAADLLISSLNRGLPAAAMLQPLLPMQSNTATASAGAAARSWVATAMPPVLEQLQQQFSSLQEPAAKNMEVWLLLLNVAAVAQAAGPSASFSSLSQFFSSQAVAAAMKAALLERTAPAVQLAVAQMISTLAGTTVALARCCFKAVAAVITDLMLEGAPHSHIGDSGSSSSSGVAALSDGQSQQLYGKQSEAAAAALPVAVRKMWTLLLQRVNSQQLLEAEVGVYASD